jgi:hypothetical protein
VLVASYSLSPWDILINIYNYLRLVVVAINNFIGLILARVWDIRAGRLNGWV